MPADTSRCSLSDSHHIHFPDNLILLNVLLFLLTLIFSAMALTCLVVHCSYREQNRRLHACAVQGRVVETEELGFAVASEEGQGSADRSYLLVNQAGFLGRRAGRKVRRLPMMCGGQPLGCLCIWGTFLGSNWMVPSHVPLPLEWLVM